MEHPKVRYIVAWFPGGGPPLVGLAGVSPFTAGWYRLYYDDEGREGFQGGPYESAEAAMRLPDNG